MSITFTNRKGKTYYLHQGKTKTGKPKYFFSLDDEGDLVEIIPPGYEIYENPNSQVYLRRIRPRIITEEEVAEVGAGMKKYCRLEHFIVDVKKNTIVVYTPDQNVEGLKNIFNLWPTAQRTRRNVRLEEFLTYSPVLQFVLTDKKKRLFETQRYSFSGSIDDWITISRPDVLPKLVKKYVRHLGEDSYYDLYGY